LPYADAIDALRQGSRALLELGGYHNDQLSASLQKAITYLLERQRLLTSQSEAPNVEKEEKDSSP
jgi:hypothetical protein